MRFLASLISLIVLFLVSTSSAIPSGPSSDIPSGRESLIETFEKRNQCSCAFVVADFKSGGPVRGIMTFAQDESGHTEVAGIFSHGFKDQSADYRFLIVDECDRTVFDLTDGLDVKLDGDEGTKSFRHKFNDISVDCTSNGILTKVVHDKKRHCNNSKLRKRLPNHGKVTQNGEGTGYGGLS